MPSNFEIAVIILLLVNLGLTIYLRNNSEYFDPVKDKEIQDRVNREKEEIKKRFTKK
jgi:hypothetical protein